MRYRVEHFFPNVGDAFRLCLREFEERHEMAIELGMDRRGDDLDQFRVLKQALRDEAKAG